MVKLTVDQPKANVNRVIFDGRLDASGTQAIEPNFNVVVAGGPNLIVDLHLVPFIASPGIRLLVAGAQAQRRRGGKLVLMGANDITRRILKTTGIDQCISVCETLDEALALF